MKVTIEVPTNEIRRLLDATSGDTNLRHVPMEQLVAEATKRGILAWETTPPLMGGVAALVETCFLLAEGWERRRLDPPPPDFRHIVNAVQNLKAAGYRP